MTSWVHLASCAEKSEDSDTDLALLLSWNRRWPKILQTLAFCSLVFVFQRQLCPPVPPTWNVAQNVDVARSYHTAPECPCPCQKSKTLPTSSKAPGSKPLIELFAVHHVHEQNEQQRWDLPFFVPFFYTGKAGYLHVKTAGRKYYSLNPIGKFCFIDRFFSWVVTLYLLPMMILIVESMES